MISRGRTLLANIPNVEFYETNGQDFSLFQDSTFDFCFSYIVFQHVPTKSIVQDYIFEVARVLKPGGIFHFQVNGRSDPDSARSRPDLLIRKIYRRAVRRPALQLLAHLKRGPRGFESDCWTGVNFSRQEIEKSCREAKLRLIRTTGIGTQYMWVTVYKPGSSRHE